MPAGAGAVGLGLRGHAGEAVERIVVRGERGAVLRDDALRVRPNLRGDRIGNAAQHMTVGAIERLCGYVGIGHVGDIGVLHYGVARVHDLRLQQAGVVELVLDTVAFAFFAAVRTGDGHGPVGRTTRTGVARILGAIAPQRLQCLAVIVGPCGVRQTRPAKLLLGQAHHIEVIRHRQFVDGIRVWSVLGTFAGMHAAAVMPGVGEIEDRLRAARVGNGDLECFTDHRRLALAPRQDQVFIRRRRWRHQRALIGVLPCAGVGQRDLLQVSRAGVAIVPGVAFTGGRLQAPAAVTERDLAPVAGQDVGRVAVAVVGEPHRVAEPIRDCAGEQVIARAGKIDRNQWRHAVVLDHLDQLGGRARHRHIEVVTYALGRGQTKAFAGQAALHGDARQRIALARSQAIRACRGHRNQRIQTQGDGIAAPRQVHAQALPHLAALEAAIRANNQRRHAALRAALRIPPGGCRVRGRDIRHIHIPVAGAQQARIIGLNLVLRLQRDVQAPHQLHRQGEVARN